MTRIPVVVKSIRRTCFASMLASLLVFLPGGRAAGLGEPAFKVELVVGGGREGRLPALRPGGHLSVSARANRLARAMWFVQDARGQVKQVVPSSMTEAVELPVGRMVSLTPAERPVRVETPQQEGVFTELVYLVAFDGGTLPAPPASPGQPIVTNSVFRSWLEALSVHRCVESAFFRVVNYPTRAAEVNRAQEPFVEGGRFPGHGTASGSAGFFGWAPTVLGSKDYTMGAARRERVGTLLRFAFQYTDVMLVAEWPEGATVARVAHYPFGGRPEPARFFEVKVRPDEATMTGDMIAQLTLIRLGMPPMAAKDMP